MVRQLEFKAQQVEVLSRRYQHRCWKFNLGALSLNSNVPFCSTLVSFPSRDYPENSYVVADHLVYLFLRFVGVSYRWFMGMRCKFNLSTYVQEPLVIGRRGCTGRDLNKETLAADIGR